MQTQDRVEDLENRLHVAEVQLRQQEDGVAPPLPIPGASAYEECDVPDTLCCPISRSLFTNPVVTGDGITYDLDQIIAAFNVRRDTSPMTNSPIQPTLLRNQAMRDLIEEYMARNPLLPQPADGAA